MITYSELLKKEKDLRQLYIAYIKQYKKKELNDLSLEELERLALQIHIIYD